MIPSFELHRPTELDGASELLDRYGDDAGVIAGGTELLLVMKLGLAEYPQLVDIKRIPELAVLEQREGALLVGATVTHRQVERTPLVRDGWPALARMTARIANARVRSTGTVGGNLCFADPHSDLATFLLAADALLVLRRGSGAERRLTVDEFWTGTYETALQPGELMVRVEVPQMTHGVGFAHERFSVHERPTATVTARLSVVGDRVRDVRLSVGCVGPMPVRLIELEQLLEGRPLGDVDAQLWAEIAAAAGADVDPSDDAEGSVPYKRHLVGVLLVRAAKAALSRALSG